MLDFGSGFGLVANHLAKDNEVLAVEPNEEMVAPRAQDRPYQQLVGSLDQIESFEDASFDVIPLPQLAAQRRGQRFQRLSR